MGGNIRIAKIIFILYISINVDKHFGVNMTGDATKNYPEQDNSNFEEIDNYLLQNETQNFLSTFKSVNQRNVIKLQLKYCPYTRLCGFKTILQAPTFPKLCCRDCSCDFPACMQKTTCCPDIVFNHINMFNASEVNENLLRYLVKGQRVQKRCISLGLFGKYETGKKNIYGYSTCPLDTEAELVQKCTRQYNANNIQDLTDTIPVISKEPFELYRNLHCALCNGMSESQVEKVKSRLTCYKNLRSLATTDILHAIYAENRCKINFLPDGNFDYCMNDIISDCYDSGTFEGRACSMYTSVIYVNHKYFQNVFCSLCNGNVPENSLCVYGSHFSGSEFSFSGLLKLGTAGATGHTETSGEKCLENQIHDTISDSCRDLTCSYITVLQHGKCIDMFERLEGITYTVSLRLKPISPLSEADGYIVADQVTYYIREILNGYLYGMDIIYKYNGTFQENDLYVVYLYVRAQYYFFTLHDPYQVIEEILNLDKSEHTFLINNNKTITFKFDVRDNSLRKSDDFLSMNDSSVKIHSWEKPLRGEEKKNIEVLSLTRCPKVNISVSDVPWLEIEEGVKFVRGDYIIATSQYYFFDENRIMLCADRYRQYMNHLSNLNSQSVISAEAIVSIVCSAISILSLCFTFFTFCLFSQLRQSIPGKNNMSLIFALLCAQSVYLIGSFGGFEKTSTECAIFGVFVHFSWLVALFWMNVCTYHTFRVLTRHKVISHSPRRTRFAFYHFYALTMAAIFLSINIAVSKSMYGTIGYGIDACYISSQRMIIYTFVIPTGVIILSNLVMFIVVIFKIKRATSVKKSVQNERNDIVIFAKLSTITGVAWSFGFLYLWTNITAMSYLFILMNASQGVFIMFAFVTNKRVFDLFKMQVIGLTVTP